jgi:hypothetical protein
MVRINYSPFCFQNSLYKKKDEWRVSNKNFSDFYVLFLTSYFSVFFSFYTLVFLSNIKLRFILLRDI